MKFDKKVVKAPALIDDVIPRQQKGRGRPLDSERRLAIAEAVLLKLIPDEAAIIQKHKKPKYSRWTSTPKKAIYLEVGQMFGVTTRWVEKSVADYMQPAKSAIVREICNRAHARDIKDQMERERAAHEQLQHYGITVKSS